TFCTAGSSRPIRTAMMAMTTSNSMSVKPMRRCDGIMIAPFHQITKENNTLKGRRQTGRHTTFSPRRPIGVAGTRTCPLLSLQTAGRTTEKRTPLLPDVHHLRAVEVVYKVLLRYCWRGALRLAWNTRGREHPT